MSKYGYIINQNYQLQENEITWQFDRVEQDNSIVTYKGIECFNDNAISTTDYVIIGNANEFLTWLNQHGQLPIDEII